MKPGEFGMADSPEQKDLQPDQKSDSQFCTDHLFHKVRSEAIEIIGRLDANLD